MEVATALLELFAIIAIALLTPGPNALTCFAHSGTFSNGDAR
jgi:threonine/homoserine/homoserine lactone efflux protein